MIAVRIQLHSNCILEHDLLAFSSDVYMLKKRQN
jgi:hypothetical protein